ncbi:unnamed protein product, partial [marine sediment metagenome]
MIHETVVLVEDHAEVPLGKILVTKVQPSKATEVKISDGTVYKIDTVVV